jgi:hypothetical protein
MKAKIFLAILPGIWTMSVFPQEAGSSDYATAIADTVIESRGLNDRSYQESKPGHWKHYTITDDRIYGAHQNDFSGAIKGRIPGVYTESPSGHFTGSSRILIRGIRTVDRDNQPQILINGIPVDNSDYSRIPDQGQGFNFGSIAGQGFNFGSIALDLSILNADSISVLTPGQAAIHGFRGRNGVINIHQSNSFTEQFTIKTIFNSSFQSESIAIYPEFQKLYGAGNSGTFQSVSIDGNYYLQPDYSSRASWGPGFDPDMHVLHWNALYPSDEENYMVARPWVYPENDHTYFFRTGSDYRNSIQFFASNRFLSARASYTDNRKAGVFPNSSQEKNILNLGSSLKYNDLASISISFDYLNRKTTGRPGLGGRHSFNTAGHIWRSYPVSLDFRELSNYINPDGSQREWNIFPDGFPGLDNPYWNRYINVQHDNHSRYILNISSVINVTDWLSIHGIYAIDDHDFANTFIPATSGTSREDRFFRESNLTLLSSLNKRFIRERTGINFLIGYSNLARTGTFKEIIRYPHSESGSSWNMNQQIDRFFGDLQLDYLNILFLKYAASRDNDGYFKSPSTSASLDMSMVLSNIGFLRKNRFISYAKVFTGFSSYTTVEPPFFNRGFALRPTIYNPDFIEPEEHSNFETGLEVNFLSNRHGIILNYYTSEISNQIARFPLPRLTGYEFLIANGYSLISKGIEFAAYSNFINAGDFRWRASFNMASINNEISNALDQYVGILGDVPFARLFAVQGESFPYIMGRDYVYDNHGNKVVGTDGLYLRSDPKPLLKVTPELFGGFENELSFKNFSLAFLFNFQRGGNTVFTTYSVGLQNGLLPETSVFNQNGKNIRDPVIEGGGIVNEGVYGTYNHNSGTLTYTDATGRPVASPVYNETRVDPVTGFRHPLDTRYIFSTDYIKLRHLTLTYRVPSHRLPVIQSMRFSLFGRNLITWGATAKYFDPEYHMSAMGNKQGLEDGYLPGTRSFGGGINVVF